MGTENDWRFDVRPASPSSDELVITRGRLYRLPDDWTTDEWRHYWDGDQMVAVYNEPGKYHSPTRGSHDDDTLRVENAITLCKWYGDGDIDAMLTRLAPRITHTWGHPQPWRSDFISVELDQGVTLYALAWDKTSAGAWAEEIEAVYHGEIYRAEVEEYNAFTESWSPAEDLYDWWYGEDAATAAFEKEFPLDEVPSDLITTSEN